MAADDANGTDPGNSFLIYGSSVVSEILKCYSSRGSVREALEAISVSTELVVEELKPHLDTLLVAVQEGRQGAAEQIGARGILCTLAQALWRKSPLRIQVALLVSELAKEASLRECFFKAGLASALLGALSSSDQDLLLLITRALGSICVDDKLRQDQLLRSGAVPLLVAILQKHTENEPLVHTCLLALCNLADMGEEDSSALVWDKYGPSCEGEQVYRGMLRSPFGLHSTVMVVRLSQWSRDQHSVNVEVVQRYSTAFWNTHATWCSSRRSPFTPLGICPMIYSAIKYWPGQCSESPHCL
ncbi:uncharacterized protein LOC108934872 [Arapaima gigas]